MAASHGSGSLRGRGARYGAIASTIAGPGDPCPRRARPDEHRSATSPAGRPNTHAPRPWSQRPRREPGNVDHPPRCTPVTRRPGQLPPAHEPPRPTTTEAPEQPAQGVAALPEGVLRTPLAAHLRRGSTAVRDPVGWSGRVARLRA